MTKRVKRALAGLMLAALVAGCLPVGASAAAAGFSDVPAGSWAAKDISRCVELGLFQGETATRFGMGHPMTRAAFTVVLGRFFGWEPVTDGRETFTDVPAGAWYHSAVETACANGAVTRQPETFRPGDPITRGEMAVMMVRALGYGVIAGLAQDLPMPFTDVETGAGYLAMAYELGIVSGTSATTFSPDRIATREQAAVMLMRTYDRYHSTPPALVGVARGEEPGNWAGFEAVAITGGRLTNTSQVQVSRPETERETRLLAAVREAGAKPLLHVTGVSSALRDKTTESAAALARTATEGGYDGIYLDFSQLREEQRGNLTALVKALDQALGEDGLLYVAADAPAWQGKQETAYDYAALGAAADRLVLRVAPYRETGDGFPTAPLEPLEEVYYALAELNGVVPGSKLSLMLTTTGSVWQGDRPGGTADWEELEAMLEDQRNTETYYSNRYACAFLMQNRDRKTTVVWYLDGRGARERARMGAFFGVDQICLSDLGSVSPELLSVLRT